MMQEGRRRDARETGAAYRRPMTLVTTSFSERVVEALRLARALCMGTAAYFVGAGGDVDVDLSRAETFPDRVARIQELARASACLPAAFGADPFWNTEALAASEQSEESLACVAIPVRSEGGWLGLLGVVDTWLPELDEEQRQGLRRLSDALGQGLTGGEPVLAIEETPVPGAVGAEIAVPSGSPGPEVVDSTRDQLGAAGGEVAGHGDVLTVVAGPGPRLVPAIQPAALSAPSAMSVPASGPVEGAGASPAGGQGPELAARPLIESVAGEGLLGELAEHVPEALVVAKADGTILFANPAMRALTGRSQERILGVNLAILVRDPSARHIGDTEPAAPARTLLGTPPPGRRLLVTAADGRTIFVDASGAGFESELAGECYIGLLRAADVGAEQAGGLTADAPRALLDALDQGIVVCDPTGTVAVANRAAWALLGLSEDEDLVGYPFPFASGLASSDGSPLAQPHHPLARAMQRTIVRSEHLQLTTRDGERRHLVASAKPFMLESGIGALLILRDVTSQLAEESRLMDLALHDPLTGLANRYLLLDYLRRVLLQFRTRGGSIALVFLDLDDFKMINDTYGHDAGDELLVSVGRRIERAVRSSDIVSRLGGDEFAVALAASEEAGELDLVVSRIRQTLSVPYQIQGRTLAVSASLGWVTADPRYVDPATLLVRADREMYQRKRERKRGMAGRGAPAPGPASVPAEAGEAPAEAGSFAATLVERRRNPGVGEDMAV